jgi:predicted Zn-ribbon and HTH transcriptional regulator
MAKTIRQMIVELLEKEQLSALDLSGEVGVKEKEIFEHLEHIARSLKPTRRLVVEPAHCRSCDFQFRKRSRIRPPSRCPHCKSELIQRPRFSIL